MGKSRKRPASAQKGSVITGMYYTNTITDNITTKKGNVKNAHKANAVYDRETSETIKL